MSTKQFPDLTDVLKALAGAAAANKAQGQEPTQNPCEGCAGCDLNEMDDELADAVNALQFVDSAKEMVGTLLMVLMVTAKQAKLPLTSQAAHALWLDA